MKTQTYLGLPVGQRNTHLAPGLTMRVGIPHTGGALSFHAFNQDYPVMVSANAFWNKDKKSFRLPQATNLSELDWALDSAGYTAMNLWKQKGRQDGMAGVYPWSYAQYIEFASEAGASWWAQADLCCEPDIASSRDEVDYRVRATATLLEGTLRVLFDWQSEMTLMAPPTVVASMLRPPVPVLQGWDADDYLRSLDLMMQVWERWTPWLDQPVLIGVGSVCRRSLDDRKHGLYAVLAALERHLPAGARLHLFGVKGACLDKLKMFDWVASADSMAYDDGARRKAFKVGHSNTMAHRSAEMTAWMDAARNRIEPAEGDQFRLPY